MDISKLRNIGISAHIDSGKTTLTERILYYCKKIHRISEVKGKDGKGATMDSMELEKERGITISSAATNVEWNGYSINIIDTPGHVDFTIEVERALRVLDSAVLVLCAVGGVQSQTITVNRQLKRYKVPHLAFINKCDRIGANPYKVTKQLSEKLGYKAVLMQLPIGLEDKFEGIIDLVKQKAYYFDGPNGEVVSEGQIPYDYKEESIKMREMLIDVVSTYSDVLTESYLDGSETEELIYNAVRHGTLSLELTPVFIGSAFKNKGIQPLLDAVIRFLPDPSEIQNNAVLLESKKDGFTDTIELKPDPDLPPVALVFKLEDGPYGQLSFLRIYQGSIKKGSEIINVRNNKRIRIGRLLKMHADEMEEMNMAVCGDIVALFGVDCESGDTFSNYPEPVSLTDIHIPDPVISLAIFPEDKKSEENLAKAINRFTKEDPTFKCYVDPESKETIIKGMGELHLDVYIERMRREYNVKIHTGKPQVAYRETISKSVPFDYTHKKQTGGAGQYARIAGIIEPSPELDYEFIDEIKGGVIPREYLSSCDKGFKEAMEKGPVIGFPLTNIKVIINDGNTHPVDSSDMAFRVAARDALKINISKAGPQILEPVMSVTVETPSEFQGVIYSSLKQRRGIIVSTTEDDTFTRIDAEVPLSELFGYATVLRSITQGKAAYTMEFHHYSRVPLQIGEKIIKQYSKSK